ncbi:MAG: O-antigen ligase family protein [Clostridia bacterium]|nr:O-antigen ligase family protein [Clostridia bacterium]
MMKRANRLLAKAADWIRTVLLAAASNEMLFFFAAFLLPAFVDTELFRWHPEEVEMYGSMIIMPWGMALCLYRLARRSQIRGGALRADIAMLFALLVWIVVPFCVRFGLTAENTTSWLGYATVYFVLYAMTTEESSERREALFDQICAMFCVLSLLLGGALLWCAWTGAQIDGDWVVHYGTYASDGFSFGVYNLSQLCHGEHYNNTGMVALCCTMFCLAGAERGKHVWQRVLYLIAAVFMMIVIVLTQSRTARYALIAAMGAGVYSHMVSEHRIPHVLVRQMLGLLTAAAVIFVSYTGAATLTDAALVHYAEREASFRAALMQESAAQTEEPAQEAVLAQGEEAEKEEAAAQPEQETVKPKKARNAVSKTFSLRTTIWGGLVEYWRRNPKNLIIGAGAGKIAAAVEIIIDYPKYGSLSMHNAYLQHTADFGLISTALLAVFFLIVLRPVLRVFFAAGKKRKPGYNAMCMMVVGALLTGMMESQPLMAMTAVNMSLFVALALLVARSHELKDEG